MKCKELIGKIEAVYPKTAAIQRDHVGLLCGRSEKEVGKVFIALDATEAIILKAIEVGADMLITHHPMFRSGIESITDLDYTGRRLLRLIQHDISYYAIHTNYDVLALSDIVGTILGLQNQVILWDTMEQDGNTLGIGRIGELSNPCSIAVCCDLVKEKFGLEHVRVFGDLDKVVAKVAISPGSGRSTIPYALAKEVDLLITGDIGHHDGLDAIDQGLAIIDAGHYSTEYLFVKEMQSFLLAQDSTLEVMIEKRHHPFQTV